MLVKTTVGDILKEIIIGNTKVTDNSVCGKCSKCGECCTPFLPVSQKEVDTMQMYVIKHKIRPQKQLLVMQNRLSCPYFDGKKCLVYEVRPLICREFYCYKTPTAETGRKFTQDRYVTVNMWKIANEIDKQVRK